MTNPRISVVIPTFGRSDALTRCLSALTRQTLAPGDFEVIVVDDGGPPGVEAAVARFAALLSCRIVRQANQGPGAARNHGCRSARGQTLAFTDDDCEPEPGWLGALVAAVDAHPDSVVGGPVTNALTDDIFAATSQLIIELAYDFQNTDPNSAEFFASNNLAMRAATFTRIGGFDPRLRIAAEDRDFCARARELGLTIVMASEAVVGHAHHSSLREFWRQHYRYGRGAWQYHALLRDRSQGRLATDVRFHGRFLGMAANRLRSIPLARSIPIALLLLTWQVANAAGFLSQSVVGNPDPRHQGS